MSAIYMGGAECGSVEFQGVSFVTADSNAHNRPNLGERLTVDGEEYVFIHGVKTLAVGTVCTISGLSGYSLTNSTTAGADIPMCVIKHAEIPSGGYGWGMIRGKADLEVVSTLATGVLITCGDNGEVATGIAGSFATGPIIGKVLSSATSGSKALCYVKCFG